MEIVTNKTIDIYFDESERKKADAIIRRYIAHGATINCQDSKAGNEYEYVCQLQGRTTSKTIL